MTNGLFTVTLDFGSVFTGAPIWLAIGVRTNGGSSFTALNPLQELTPTPYAIYTANAGTAATAGSVSAANIVGAVSAAQLPSTTAFLNSNQVFTGQNTFPNNVAIGTTNFATSLNVDVNNGGGFSTPAVLFEVENCGAPCGQPAWTEAVRLWNQNEKGRVGLGFLCGLPGTLTNVPTVYLGTGDSARTATFALPPADRDAGRRR